MKLPEFEPDAAKAMLAMGEALDEIQKRYPGQAHVIARWLLGTALEYWFSVQEESLETVVARVRSIWPKIRNARENADSLVAQARAMAAKGDN